MEEADNLTICCELVEWGDTRFKVGTPYQQCCCQGTIILPSAPLLAAAEDPTQSYILCFDELSRLVLVFYRALQASINM